jgi:pyrroloquinoline quinone (PQQ) biosynthesis protein C
MNVPKHHARVSEVHSSLREKLQERLLAVMDEKHHGAFVHLTRPGLSRAQLLVHFRHELHTYVRDFPALLARVLGQGPPPDVRIALAENIYEEQTGKLSFGKPHPELFLVMMEGLGYSRDDLLSKAPALEQESILYRSYLDRVSIEPPWVVGAAVLTIFVEGSVHERAEMSGTRALPSEDELLSRHPLVKHYGCPRENMWLVRAHRAVEGDHRKDAWASVLDHVHDEAMADRVVRAVSEARTSWLRYRDGVARAMGVPILQ